MNISQTNSYQTIARLNKSVHELHVSLYPKYFKKYNYESIREFFRRIINHRKFIFLLLEDEEKEIGYAWIEIKDYPSNVFKNAYRSLYVHQISIVETQRKKGYGSKLMNYIYELAKEKKIDIIELEYWFQNERAKDFYKKHGFKKYREFVYKEL
ncbi:GNAT family N-acetyltransferase [Priestia megaterium]|uniref:GNAT family N-acetyltransferase n=1 Tax=Priestia megaterium TaxID=1404 RepID=UPI000BF5460B|nr:GNAT family N-acetyltransferase [Priestia megaterium]PFK80067.1 GNAT family N-acetyltransferase [Priestia megaterium]